MNAHTIEFTPDIRHPWMPLVSEAVGEGILGLPTEVHWDAAAMAEYLRPGEFTYHGTVVDEQLTAFAALRPVSRALAPGPDLHMDLVYLAATKKAAEPEAARAEMLRRAEGAAIYAGAVVLQVFPCKGEIEFYVQHGYARQPRRQAVEFFKSLKAAPN